MRAVVTGGAGFLGSHLCERLIELGWAVLCIDNFATGRPDNVAHLVGRREFELTRADVTSRVEVPGNVDAVLHLASPASPNDYLKLKIETLKAGSIGTMNALELARSKRARFLLASTSEVYGDPLEHPQRESYQGNVDPVGPRAVYDEAKRFSEAMVTAYRSTHEMNTGIVRIFNTFGPRLRGADGRVVPTFIGQALAGAPLTVAGDGRQTRSLCYVDDMVEGILCMMRSDYSGPVNLGTTHELSMLDLAYWIRTLTGSRSEISFIDRSNDPQLRRPDISLARRVLGWEPKTSVEEGLRRTIAWVRGEAASTANAGAHLVEQ